MAFVARLSRQLLRAPAAARSVQHARAFHAAAPRLAFARSPFASQRDMDFNITSDGSFDVTEERMQELAEIFDHPEELQSLDLVMAMTADIEKAEQDERRAEEDQEILRLKNEIPFATALDGTVVTLTRELPAGARVTVEFDLDDGEDAPVHEKMMIAQQEAGYAGGNDDVLDGKYDSMHDPNDTYFDSDSDADSDSDSDDEGSANEKIKAMLRDGDASFSPDGVVAGEDGPRMNPRMKIDGESLIQESVVVPFRVLFRLPNNAGELVAHCNTTANDQYRVEHVLVDESPSAERSAEDDNKALFAPEFSGLDPEAQTGFGFFMDQSGVGKQVFEYMNLLAARHHGAKMLGWLNSVAKFAVDWKATVGDDNRDYDPELDQGRIE